MNIGMKLIIMTISIPIMLTIIFMILSYWYRDYRDSKKILTISEQELVKLFHELMGFTINNKPTIIDHDTNMERLRLLRNEVDELEKGIMNVSIIEIADALADIIYIVRGTIIAHGLDMVPIFIEVHRSNMTKSPLKVHDETITGYHVIAWKGQDYVPPNLIPILKEQSK